MSIIKRTLFLLLSVLVFNIIFIQSTFGGDVDNSVRIAANKNDIMNQLISNKKHLLASIDLDNEEKIYSTNIYKSYFKELDSKDWEFYSNLIPEEFMVSFMYYTRNNKEMRALIYAIMKHESLNFLEFTNINHNGSIDHGPMMINSVNLKNDYFMELYAPNKEVLSKMGFNLESIDGIYNYYIGIGCNLIFSHIEKYIKRGSKTPIKDALRAYNGGERVNTIYASQARYRKTTAYAKRVLSIYYETLREYKNT